MKEDLQKTNVAPPTEKQITINDIRTMIVGDESKITLLNIFDNLITDINKLRAELDASRREPRLTCEARDRLRANLFGFRFGKGSFAKP